jgi:hypothetical protein
MNHVDIGDRVNTDRGPGTIVNLEMFTEKGDPYYETEPRGRYAHAPAANNRWGVKLDDPVEAGSYKDGILYYTNEAVRKLKTIEVEVPLR